MSSTSGIPTVFLNASVVLAGLKSPTGGSGKILTWGKTKKIYANISEIVLDEIMRNIPKIDIDREQATHVIRQTISLIHTVPSLKTVQKYQSAVIDEGDAHILASCDELKTKYLITLDKKHLLILQNKLKWMRICSPGEFIEAFSERFSTCQSREGPASVLFFSRSVRMSSTASGSNTCNPSSVT